jgi:hypothetical protein
VLAEIMVLLPLNELPVSTPGAVGKPELLWPFFDPFVQHVFPIVEGLTFPAFVHAVARNPILIADPNLPGVEHLLLCAKGHFGSF